ncbi:hypothetical protein [Desulfoscipio geothermicus]|uniref:Uncharacterized protein n=1 Tax=Desulfoscipio geothermicus DSM 3669 TaxID=1121426 RepID=A0A1I6E530_9FIRM|nr:hypothetical protein [Desulfoscipio geothermicus]SFR12632.1 hypothetical protein SAMN05660706_12569 [Desulfoscipio geothermicus DSM 3669]
MRHIKETKSLLKYIIMLIITLITLIEITLIVAKIPAQSTIYNRPDLIIESYPIDPTSVKNY